MDYCLLLISILLTITGLIGCILPVLPGPILCFIGLLVLQASKFADVSGGVLLFLGLLTITVTVLDYMVPAWGTKKFGGSTYGTVGSVIGLILGLFFLPAIGPFGIITILGGPFLGAYVGEKMGGRDSEAALRAAFGSFIGFLAGTLMKIANSVIIIVFMIKEMIEYF